MNGRNTIAAMIAVSRHTELSPEARLLWVLYRGYDSGKGAWPSDALLAQTLGKSIRSVKVYRKELLSGGFLQQTLRGPRLPLYRAVLPADMLPPEADGGPVKKMHAPPRKKAPRATQLPEDWQPSEAHAQLAVELRVDVQAQADHFRDHAAATGRTLNDWDAGFRAWLRKSADMHRGRPYSGNGRPRTTDRQTYIPTPDDAVVRRKR